MIIVMEGCDATGKTTLADLIANARGSEVRHFGPPEQHPLTEWGMQFDEGVVQNVIFDRLHWGEPVYAPIYRDGSELGVTGFRWFEMMLAARGAITVLAEGDPDAILQRIISLNDDYVEHSLDHVNRISTAYQELRPQALTPVYAHNIDAGEVLSSDTIAQVALTRATDVPRAVWATGYIGVPTPAVLLVTDSDTDASNPFVTLPLPPYPYTPGELLLDAIIQYFPSASRVWGFVKASDDLPALWDELGRPRIVALGGYASDAISEMGLPHGVSLHPRDVALGHGKSYAMSLAAAAETQGDTRWLVTRW